jgi:CHRD domain-containing protein
MTLRNKYVFLGTLLMAAFVLVNCTGGGSGGGAATPETGTIVGKSAVLSGGEEVPPAATSANGSGVLEVNTTTGTAGGRLTIGTAPTSTIIAVHVQEGVRGANGSIVIVLENSGGGVWLVPSGSALSPTQVNLFSSGALYFNVHTAANPNGEIRGQIDGAAAGASRRSVPATPAGHVSAGEKRPHSFLRRLYSPASAGK